MAQLVLAQKAGDQPAVDPAAEHLLVDPDLAGSVAAVPGLGASVRLIQARSRFAAGHLADVPPLLQRALADAERDGVPAVLLDVLSMLALRHHVGRPRPQRRRPAPPRERGRRGARRS